MTAPAPSPAKSFLSRLRILILIPLLLSLVYSITVLIREWTPPERERMLSGTVPVLHALLFQQGTKLDLFDTYTGNGLVRSAAGALTSSEELNFPPRILSTKVALLSESRHARVRAMTSTYSYDPLEGQESPLILLARNMNYTFALMDEQSPPHLRIDFAGCGTLADIPLSEHPDWYKPVTLFQIMGLLQQRMMRLSPAETSLAIVHHAHVPHIMLVDVIGRNVIPLSVPSFDPEQLHFSPFFINEETLLFSVLDGKHWGTVRYHLSTGTYEVLSENFTDHAYHSLTGKVILQQSFFDSGTNIPFGSTGLLGQRQNIPLRVIENLTGPRENNHAIFSLLFENPEESSLHFKTDLTSQSFNAIAESTLREPLRTLWREKQLKLTRSVGVFRLLNLEPDDTLTPVETIPFEIHPPAISAQYVKDTEPLLRALEVPATLIEEYRKRSADAAKTGEEYMLVDDLSY